MNFIFQFKELPIFIFLEKYELFLKKVIHEAKFIINEIKKCVNHTK